LIFDASINEVEAGIAEITRLAPSISIPLLLPHLVLPKYLLSIVGYDLNATNVVPALSLQLANVHIITFSQLTLTAVF
jgi:hypothetical protein